MKIATITGALLLVATAAGCCGDKTPSAPSPNGDSQRQEPVQILVDRFPSSSIMVFTDHETGCEYLFATEGYVMTPRMARDGLTHKGCIDGRSVLSYDSPYATDK